MLVLLLILGIIIIQLIWMLTDPRTLREQFSKKTLFVYSITVLIIGPQIISSLFFPLSQTKLDNLIEKIGIIIYLAGAFFALWAKFEMKNIWGLPGEHNIKRQNRLITTGPYMFSRHPIYLGLFLVAFGFSLAVHSILIFLTVFLYVYFQKSAEIEEKLLEKHFGEKYVNYKNKVKRLLII